VSLSSPRFVMATPGGCRQPSQANSACCDHAGDAGARTWRSPGGIEQPAGLADVHVDDVGGAPRMTSMASCASRRSRRHDRTRTCCRMKASPSRSRGCRGCSTVAAGRPHGRDHPMASLGVRQPCSHPRGAGRPGRWPPDTPTVSRSRRRPSRPSPSRSGTLRVSSRAKRDISSGSPNGMENSGIRSRTRREQVVDRVFMTFPAMS